MKVLIIDNEESVRTGMRLLLEKDCSGVTEIAEAAGVQAGLAAIQRFKPDVLFLDVEMDDGTGFDLVQQVKDPQFQLIFVTAYNKYAMDAFRFSAIDYLLKPVDPEALQKSLDRAAVNIQSAGMQEQVRILLQQIGNIQNKERKIVLKDMENTWFVKVRDILYCEAEGTYTRFFLQDADPLLVSKNLKEYEEILEPLGFIRTHHSFLANPDKIRSYDKTDGGSLILENGRPIPVSLRKKDFVLQFLENR